MKVKKIYRICVDAAMLIVTVLLMASKRTGIMLHILLGIVLFILLVIHNALNASWWGSVGQGRYSRGRWISAQRWPNCYDGRKTNHSPRSSYGR